MISKTQSLPNGQFRRLTGVKKETFQKMLQILEEAERIKKSKGGRNNKLSLEEQLLMTLEYLREYRTYFHISRSYGISESTAFKTIKWVEDVLVKSKEFSLPGKKALQGTDVEFEVVIVDATETPIERPKKTKGKLLR